MQAVPHEKLMSPLQADFSLIDVEPLRFYW